MRENESALSKMVQPWQEEITDIALKIEKKVKELTITKEEVEK